MSIFCMEQMAGLPLQAKTSARLNINAHETIDLHMDLSKIHFFDIDSEERIV